ncbi:MAG: TraB/GumN family protein [Candidatus Paracaedimonas acanthamoebae]|uniref:TraB/GumN family protein n=1 Tax=Candidatus Paracaedimonas acanthamoebae TaxID=244581 RepID=A0A8J7TUK6_9PROT|nr:TraB/GumN family protein [Candidatus Paracaedimonas acanthamoebae]
MSYFFKKFFFILTSIQSFSTGWGSSLPLKNNDQFSEDQVVKQSLILQSKISALVPMPRQHRPYLYKLTPPQDSNYKKFTVLGTNHAYPHCMLPPSVLKKFSEAQHAIFELTPEYWADKRSVTKEELKRTGAFINIPAEVERLVKQQLEWLQAFYEEQEIENPSLFKREDKISFLQSKQAEEELRIKEFLTNWDNSLSDERRQYILALLQEEFPELNLTDIGVFHPIAVSQFLQELEYMNTAPNHLEVIDHYLYRYSLESSIPVYNLDTITLRYEAQLNEFAENVISLDIFSIESSIELMAAPSKPLQQKAPRSLEDHMEISIIYDYHHNRWKATNNSIACDLRTQAWLPKLEKYIQLKEDTFVAVGIAHTPDILKWAQEKGYTIKRSKH